MLDKKTMSELIAIVMHGGADFVEVFSEHTKNDTISYSNKKIETVADSVVSGVGIRAFVGTKTYFACTTDLSPSGLRECAQRVAQAVGRPVDRIPDFYLTERIPTNIHHIKTLPSEVPAAVRAELLRTACAKAYDYDQQVIQVSGNVLCYDKQFVVANSEGLYTGDRQVRTRISVSAVASNGI